MTRELAAVIFLLLAGVTPCLALVAHVRRSRYSPCQLLFLFLATLLTRLWWRAGGSRRLPDAAAGGAVVVCNHRSSVDPFFIQTIADRPTHWMVAREFCEHPAFAWFLLGICEAIPVGREGIDTRATRTCIRLAAEGGIVGVFPEGRINMTERFMLPGRPGAVLIALRARVPIIPCYIEGSPYDRVPWSPFFMPARVRLRIGEPLDLSAWYDQEPDKEVVQRLMLDCLNSIRRLADCEAGEAQLAGRDWKPSRQELERDMLASRRRARRR